MVDSPLTGDNQQGEPSTTSHSRVRNPARLVGSAVTEPVRAVAFWSATTLPLVYLPLLAFGLDNQNEAGLFLGLVALHVVALFVGRSYSSE